MHNYFIFLMLVFLAAGCKKEIPLQFSEVEITKATFSECEKRDCPEIFIKYPEAKGSAVADSINKHIKNITVALLDFEQDVLKTSKTIEEAAFDFFNTQLQYETDFVDEGFVPFEAIIESQLLFESEDLISFKTNFYIYTGGAHGYSGVRYLNIDKKSGAKLKAKKLFTNLSAFTTLVEKKFRETYDITTDNSINSTGFWFENEVFYLPENIGITENEIILAFNSYEIAAYMMGVIEVRINKLEAKDLLQYQ